MEICLASDPRSNFKMQEKYIQKLTIKGYYKGSSSVCFVNQPVVNVPGTPCLSETSPMSSLTEMKQKPLNRHSPYAVPGRKN